MMVTEVSGNLQPFDSIDERRKASIWTRVHPIFAIGQLGIFVVSLVLLGLYFFHVVSFATVYLSVLVKIFAMIGAIVSGSLWERDVFGPWWFAHEFFLEDVMTLNVFVLHVGFLITVYAWPSNEQAMIVMLLLAYGAYGFNAVQYIVRHVSGASVSGDPKAFKAA